MNQTWQVAFCRVARYGAPILNVSSFSAGSTGLSIENAIILPVARQQFSVALRNFLIQN